MQYLVGGALLHRVAAVHHQDVVGNLADDAEVVADEYDADAVFALQVTQQFEDGLLHRHVKGCGGFVGDEDVGVVDECHGNHHALFLAAADLMRIAVEYLFGAGEKHFLEKLYDFLFQNTPSILSALSILMGFHHFHHLLAAFLHRVERSHWLLENHADTLASDVAEARFVEGEQVGVAKPCAAVDGGLFGQ